MGEKPARPECGSARPTGEHDLFISYAHRDNHDGWVKALVEAIEQEHLRFATRPLKVFFDQQDIRSMDDWEHRILGGLRSAKFLLAVLSPHFFDSAYCRKEWEIYLDHELARAFPGEGIAPIYIVTDPRFDSGQTDAALARWLADLKRRQYVELRPWRDEGIDALRREDVRQRLAELDHRITERLERAADRSSSPTTIPPHNAAFVGRLEELRRLRELLALGRIGAITAVHGIAGIGKSALAFEYAHAYAEAYPGGRFLVHCASIASLRGAIISLAPLLGIELTPDEHKDPDGCLARVRAALQQGGRKLLLFDNMDDAALLAPEARARCLPANDNVHALVTTRLEPQKLHGLEPLSLDTLPEADAVELLKRYRDPAGDDECAAARRIVRRVGGHALAC